MPGTESNVGLDKQAIVRDLIAMLEEITSDWDLAFSGGIGPETRLIADLQFESIDVVQLVVAIEERFQRRDLPFEKLLMTDGHYVEELHVSQVADFLHAALNP